MCAVGVGGADAVDVMAGLPWELKAPKVQRSPALAPLLSRCWDATFWSPQGGTPLRAGTGGSPGLAIFSDCNRQPPLLSPNAAPASRIQRLAASRPQRRSVALQKGARVR